MLKLDLLKDPFYCLLELRICLCIQMKKIKPLKGYEWFEIGSSLLRTKILNCQATARTITQHNNVMLCNET